MNELTPVFLGSIAVATVVMAAIQVGVLVYVGRLARRIERIVTDVEQELKPLFANLTAISRDAARAASLAAAQVERADRVFAEVSQRIEQTAVLVQQAVVTPAREGFAVLSGLRAALAALREMRENARGRRRSEDEDALFIG